MGILVDEQYRADPRNQANLEAWARFIATYQGTKEQLRQLNQWVKKELT